MFSIYSKELSSFFSSMVGYLVLSLFLIVIGLFMWVFTSTSVLEYNFASLDQLFGIAPLIFVFLIPAITMRSFSEERQRGTIEFLVTKPLSDLQIVLGKYFAALSLVVFALIPTLIYYYSIYQLGSPVGNIDSGAVIGSYIGLIFLAGTFVAIGVFASSLTDNQIIAFLISIFLCFVVHWAFNYLSELPIFFGRWDDSVQKLGSEYHYNSISKGKIDTRDIIYFLSIIGLFIWLTLMNLDKRRW